MNIKIKLKVKWKVNIILVFLSVILNNSQMRLLTVSNEFGDLHELVINKEILDI